MDGIQKLLAVVIVSLTVLLIIVGVQVIFIMVGLRRVIKRINSILEDSILGGGLLRPEKLTGIIEMIRRRRKVETREQGTLQREPPASE